MGRRRQIFSAITAVFRPILWALGMETPIYKELKPNAGSVESWYTDVKLLCISDSNARDRFNDSESLLVHKIKMYKASSLSRHEYVVAEVCPKDHPKVYIKLERLRSSNLSDRASTTQNPDNRPASPPRSFTPNLTSLDSISTASKDSSFKGRQADDQVSVLKGWPVVKPIQTADGKDTTLIGDVSFQNITLYDLIIIVNTLHNHSPDYELFTRQCYWFANLTIRVLERIDHSSTRALDYKTDSEFLREGLSGKWTFLQIHKEEDKMVELLAGQFEEERDKFRNLILEHTEHDKRVANAELRADTEARRADTEARMKEALAEEVKTKANLLVESEERVRQLMEQLELERAQRAK